MKKPTVLMILDGFGINDNPKANAIAAANTPNLDRLFREYPWVKGAASGLAVGLPDGQMGNSEVGHMNMGAGRVVYQDLTRITKEIEDGTFFENKALLDACDNCRRNNSALHLWGLVSDGGVHSHISHIYGLLELAAREKLEKVYVHCFLDGRDTPPASGLSYVKALQEKMQALGTGKVGTVIGRYYAMDRDNRWERVVRAYRALTAGEGEQAEDVASAIAASYERGVTDEFMEPIIACESGEMLPRVQDKDSVVFFNFRPDRAREISRAFLDDAFAGFEREQLRDLVYVFFTDYDHTIPHRTVAFKKQELNNTFGQYLAACGLKQLRLAETEKYAHVTFFFNGGVEEPNAGEDRILVPSPKVATYDLQPEMSAHEVCDRLVEAIEGGRYDVIIVNFANPDMVGHTGIMEAAVSAIEAVDACVGRATDALLKADGQMLLCADHGNADLMQDYETGAPMTAHTTSPVPFILINYKKDCILDENGRLCDIVPTLLAMMELEQPAEMTGRSLLKSK